jgi:hypothetical protein
VLLLAVLVAMSVVAMTGGFGFRAGKYRRAGLIAGSALLIVVMILVMGNHIH